MPQDNFNDFGVSSKNDVGSLKTQEFAQRWPTVASVLARQASSENGSPMDTPESAATALYSNAGLEKITGLINDPSDDAINGILNFQAPNTAGQSQEQATNALFGSAEQNLMNVRNAKGNVLVKMMDAQGELDKLSQFNKASYTKKRIKELDPVSDIDADIADLRQQMFVAQSFLDADPRLQYASPSERNQARAQNMSVFTNAIGELTRQRTERLQTAQGQIDDELSSHDDQINASTSRINALGRQLDFIKETGQDNEAMISLRSDLMREQERLRKLRAGAGGKAGTAYSTQKEMARIRLRQQFITQYKRDPDKEEEEAIDNTVDNYFMEVTQGRSITGAKGSENMSINPDGLKIPDLRQGTSVKDTVSTAKSLDDMGLGAEADKLLNEAGISTPTSDTSGGVGGWFKGLFGS